MDSKIMEALDMVLPLVNQITGEDYQISLCDRETALKTWKAKGFSMPAAVPGNKLDRNNPALAAMMDAMEKNKRDMEQQELAINNQTGEQARINAAFDEELARLQQLWAQRAARTQ